MSVTVREISPTLWVVVPAGRMDHLLTPVLENTLARLLEQGARSIVVDMAAVPYINSGGLRALVTGWRRARAAGGNLLLAAMGPHVRDIFEMVGFQQVFATYDTVEAACAAVGKKGA